MRGKFIIALATVFLCFVLPNAWSETDSEGRRKETNSANTLDYFRDTLLGREVWLKEDVVFGRLWTGIRKDVTNVLEDGVWYRSHALMERDPEMFIIAAVNSKWGNSFCEKDYTPHTFYRGEKVKIFEVSQKRKNILVAYFRAESNLKTGVFFDFEEDALGIPSQKADEFIERIFAFSEDELLSQDIGAITLGMSEEDVQLAAGPPEVVLFPQPGVKVFIYEKYSVIFVDGEVSLIRY